MKKMIHYQRYILLCMLMLCCGVSVYGNGTYYYSKAVAKVASASTGRGTVYVTNPGNESSPASENSEKKYNEKDNKDHTYQFKVGSTTVGYTFDGWYENETGGSKITSGLNGSTLSYKITSSQTDGNKTPTTKTLYARWNPNNYDVILNANGGSGSNQTVQATFDAAMPTTLKAGGAITTPIRTNYTFVGYFDAQTDGIKYYNSDLSSAHTWNYASAKTLYAHWTATYYGRAESYANPSAGGGTWISCNGNKPTQDSHYKASDSSNRSYSNQSSQPSCPAYYEAKQYDGYKLNGWYTDENGTGTLKSSDLSYTEYFTLTAVTEAARTTIKRYAYFVPVTVNSVSPSSTSVTFTKPETKSVTLTFNVSNADATADFNTPSISNTTDWSLTSWSYANNQVTVVVSMTVTGNVTASGAHNTTVTLTSKGTSDNQSKSATINATVNMNPVFTCAISDHYMVDAAALDLNTVWTSTSNGTKSYKIVSFTPSSANNSGLVSAPTITKGQLSLGQAGTVELKLEQVATTGYNSGETTKTITIHKYNSTFSQVSNLATTVGSTTSSNYTLTYVKPNAEYVETTAPAAAGTPGLGSTSGNFYYTLGHKVTTDKQTGCPDQYKTVAMTYAADTKIATGRNQGVDTVHLYQKETYKYTSANTSFTVAVSKLPNTIYVKGNENYSSSIYVDSYDNGLTFTATNTDYSGSPIQVSQTAGLDLATYWPDQNAVYSSYKLGTATWSVTQPENYKYLAGENTFSVTVAKASEATDCYVLNEPTEYSIGKYGDAPNTQWFSYSWEGKPAKLTFKMWKYNKYNDIGNHVYIYDANGNEISADSKDYSISSMSTTEQEYTINLSENARSVRFQNGGGTWGSASSLNTYVKDVKVTRKTWLNVGTDNSAINGTLTIDKKADGVSAIYPGENGQKGTTVYWSIANGGNLKIKCDDPRFTFSLNTITNVDCKSGTTAITAYYSDTIAGAVTATATVYNDVYNRTFTVKGVIEKADQAITWNKEVLSIDNSYTGVASASSTNRVTYYSPNESIIRVDEDEDGYKTILTAVGTGNVEITATAEGDNFYAEKVSKKNIQVTDKLIQWIEWNQPLFGLKLGGANETLTAVATSAVEGCSSSRLIEYTSSDESVVKVVNFNQLQIIGVGTAYVTATQAGGVDSDGHDYEATSTEKKVIVRDPNAPCESYVYQQENEVRFDLGWDASNKQTRSQEIEFNGKVPGACTFRYKGEHRTVWPVHYYDGTMYVEEYYEGAWHLVENGNLGKPTKSSYNTANLMLDRRSTKMRIVASNGLGYHYFTDCQVEQARFIETTAPVAFNANVGQIVPQDIYLSYSNITDNLSLTMNQGANSHFSVDKTSIEGSCGGYANNVKLTIRYHSDAEETNAQDKLIITDGTTTCEVTLTGNASRVNQHINWDHADETDVYTVHTETLSAEARTDLDKKASDVAFSFASNSTATGNISTENVLSFTSAGVANIVAHTANSNLYFPATNVVKHWNVSLTPTQISTLPNIGEITSGTAANAIDLTGWQATNTVNSGVVGGMLSITAGDLTTVGTNTITLHFAPDNTNMYSPCDRTMSVTVVQRQATEDEIGTLTADPIIYGQKLSDADLSLSGSLNGQGTFTWTDSRKDNVENVGTYNNLQVRFTPNNKNIAPKDLTVNVMVNKMETLNVPVELAFCPGSSEWYRGTEYTEAGTYPVNAEGVNRDTVYNVTVTVLQPTTGTDSKTITVGAAESWNGEDLSGYAVGEHSVVYHTTNVVGCDSTVTLTLTVTAPIINEFTGNGDWNDASNWTSGVVPQESAPDVIINGDLIINGEVTVGNLTIEKDSRVVLTVTGDLTVNGISEDREEYGNMYVENGGEVAVNGSLAVGDLTVEASIGTANGSAESGQVVNAENIVYANAYIEINMDPSGEMDDSKWYGFTVPFAVDAKNGVSRLEGATYRQCVYGTDYVIAEYDADKRLNSGNGWKYISGNTLNAGQFYFFGVDGSYNTYRFKASGNSYTPAPAASLYVNGDISNYHANWNGVGNSTLQHVTASYAGGEYVQVYMNGKDAYKTVNTNDATFVVGCPFFIQAKESTTLMLSEQNSSTEKYYAPHRMSENSNTVARINLSSADGGYSDQIYFSAADKEQDAYIIGRDLSKAGVSTIVPQLWLAQYNQKLSVHEAILSSNSATCPLGIYAPAAGNYELKVEQAPENVMLYLTYNGRAIWNLTYSPYVFDLTKGTMEGYGLKMYVMQVATDVETVSGDWLEVSGNRKVLIDDVIYIVTPEGKMYDITGKSANY